MLSYNLQNNYLVTFTGEQMKETSKVPPSLPFHLSFISPNHPQMSLLSHLLQAAVIKIHLPNSKSTAWIYDAVGLLTASV